LLVVVAIIALLIAILLPSLGRARERAKITQCLSNCRSLAQTYRVYLQLTGASGMNGVQTTTGSTQWLGVLKPYGKMDKVRLCPDTVEPAAPLTTNGHGSATVAWKGDAGVNGGSLEDLNTNLSPPVSYNPKRYYSGSYGMNGWLFDPLDPAKNPSQVVSD